tara:strand:- start:524 stop:742 length:219 start_codon:yes stop_codon:yes gene_type:complete
MAKESIDSSPSVTDSIEELPEAIEEIKLSPAMSCLRVRCASNVGAASDDTVPLKVTEGLKKFMFDYSCFNQM